MKIINQKNSTNKLSMIFIVIFSLPLMAMQEEKIKQQNLTLEQGNESDDEIEQMLVAEVPIENNDPLKGNLSKFLKKIYDESFILESENIFEAFAKLKAIFFTRKRLYELKADFCESNERSLQNYKNLLKKHFLEKREGKEGLYPKNTEWGTGDFDKCIAKFMQNPCKEDPILVDLLAYCQGLKITNLHEIVHLLLFYNANPNVLGKTQNSSLIIACRDKDNYHVVRTLIAYSADIDWQNAFDESPLTTAVLLNNKPGAEILLDNGANIYLDSYHGTAVEIAKINKNSEILALLKKHQKSYWCTLY